MDIAIFWRRRNYNNAKAFEARIHKLLPYLPRMFVALPLPQVILLTDNSSNPGVFYFLSTLTPLQYALRIYRIYVLLKRFPGTRTEIGRQLKAMLDFIPFILVAHVSVNIIFFS
ncbi:unnamed protein product [Prunus armeniaca]|uniref:Ion transport domain-containing protein n=1 Tax=Prunus armeniaca TaxID=36596 RepID=A0A6J5VGR4_PRUAR|nr:unnamed protein product [Prunus armeniaca]